MEVRETLTTVQWEKMKNQLLSKLEKVNNELEKVRDCSPLKDGWQTSKFAKKSRKYDELAKAKFAITQVLLEDYGIEV